MKRWACRAPGIAALLLAVYGCIDAARGGPWSTYLLCMAPLWLLCLGDMAVALWELLRMRRDVRLSGALARTSLARETQAWVLGHRVAQGRIGVFEAVAEMKLGPIRRRHDAANREWMMR